MTQNNQVILTAEKLITDQTIPSWVDSLFPNITGSKKDSEDSWYDRDRDILESKTFVAENVSGSVANHARLDDAVPSDPLFI